MTAGTQVGIGKKAAHEIFFGVADAIAKQDIDQEDRERIADAVADALGATRLATHFHRDVFDPLSPCIGSRDGTPCPEERLIRIGMHLSSAPDGRSEMWRKRRPQVRCVGCGP